MRIPSCRLFDLEECRSPWAEIVQRNRVIFDDTSIGGEDPGMEFDGHLSPVDKRDKATVEEGDLFCSDQGS